MTDEARRIIFVHAHPDDETIATGATMAHYAAGADAHVTLVTCTLGEEGEIHVPALARLEAAQGDQLGGYRIAELRAALDALGVTDHVFLGGAGRYRDSGMMDTPANAHPRAFWGASLDEAAGELAAILRERRPQVLVTYDPIGLYGHPDHIQAHRVSMRAVDLAAEGPDAHRVAKVYYSTVARRELEPAFEIFRRSSDNPFGHVDRVEDLPFGVPDEEITARIEAAPYAKAKLAALHAHATQIPADNWLFTLAAQLGDEGVPAEHFILARGERGPGEGEHSWESDLFAGL